MFQAFSRLFSRRGSAPSTEAEASSNHHKPEASQEEWIVVETVADDNGIKIQDSSSILIPEMGSDDNQQEVHTEVVTESSSPTTGRSVAVGGRRIGHIVSRRHHPARGDLTPGLPAARCREVPRKREERLVGPASHIRKRHLQQEHDHQKRTEYQRKPQTFARGKKGAFKPKKHSMKK
eukprot:GEZU01032997.1.p1 GENE.GEZU01032997.1~~GEZU01032997.1.p1  ORF type:complete len:178 (-),score=42.11 GEZU01032997.1:425-958(-)